MIYPIESGDTLLGIAIQRGTTVEEILALNPGIVPENLQIGQPVILPPPPTVNPLLAPGTAVPIQVIVSKIHAYQTPVGSLWLLGEVTNAGETAVENIQVEIGLLGADGRLLGSVQAWVATAIIQPGERGPFGALLNEPPSEFAAGNAQPSVAVIGGQSVVGAGQPHAGPDGAGRHVNHQQRQRFPEWHGGECGRNGRHPNPAHRHLYDAQGNVTGYQQQVLAEEWAWGRNWPFQPESAPPGGATVAYTLHAEAQTLNN
ncbi:MAG: LysM peptidoglycan-binding domain-containing protein [Anaerolineaceae bacterium]|nr:LysM peptidoglycan-binding domain-containing protein [Anaerolineaceae bacterium]